jgi:hypothetical protein
VITAEYAEYAEREAARLGIPCYVERRRLGEADEETLRGFGRGLVLGQ